MENNVSKDSTTQQEFALVSLEYGAFRDASTQIRLLAFDKAHDTWRMELYEFKDAPPLQPCRMPGALSILSELSVWTT